MKITGSKLNNGAVESDRLIRGQGDHCESARASEQPFKCKNWEDSRMVYRSFSDMAKAVAIRVAENRVTQIRVRMRPDVVLDKPISCYLYEVDPRLLPCIKDVHIHMEKTPRDSYCVLRFQYTDILPSAVTVIRTIPDLQEATYRAVSLHRRSMAIVYTENLHEKINTSMEQTLKSPRFLSCYIAGYTAEVKKSRQSAYQAITVFYTYSCNYAEHKLRQKRMKAEIKHIVEAAEKYGVEDWEKAFRVVQYCVKNWKYGHSITVPRLEYTAYGALVNKRAVCMGISLAMCEVFEELKIPCRYITGKRNGVGHAWNLIYINGWFYIDVTDCIAAGDPLYHWGFVECTDRIISENTGERLVCHYGPGFIRRQLNTNKIF